MKRSLPTWLNGFAMGMVVAFWQHARLDRWRWMWNHHRNPAPPPPAFVSPILWDVVVRRQAPAAEWVTAPKDLNDEDRETLNRAVDTGMRELSHQGWDDGVMHITCLEVSGVGAFSITLFEKMPDHLELMLGARADKGVNHHA